MEIWNVRGTLYEAALKDLKNEIKRYRIDLLALQKGDFVLELKNYIFFNSGNEYIYLLLFS